MTAPTTCFPVWSPDGGRIAWSRGVKGVYEIWVMNADGSGKTQITFEGVRSRVPTWSPNGDRIAFGRSGDLWAMDADGSDQQQLTSGPNLDLGPRWSPVEDRIAFFSDRNGGSAVYTMRSDGTQIAQMTPDALNAGAPDWSPDGNRLSFSDNFCATCASESVLFVMDVDGSHLRQLTDTDPANEGGGGWSPDGTNIVTDVPTLYGNHLRKADVAVIAVDGGDVVYITQTLGIDEQHPDWSPV
jgi:Tol biopolymer transport system component